MQGRVVSGLVFRQIEHYAPWLVLQQILFLSFLMIKLLFWNIRGVARAPNLRRLRKLIKLYDLQLVVVVEPKLRVESITDIRIKLGMDCCMFNHWGSVWIFYRSLFTCQITGESPQHITIRVQSHLFQDSIILSCIHAKCMQQDREDL